MRAERPSFLAALAPVLVLLALLVYGLVLRPWALRQPALPLQAIFGLSAAFAIAELLWLGHSWEEIRRSIVSKFRRVLSAVMILPLIGAIISTWMIAGTIPMLVVYGLKLINPDLIYLVAFVIPAIFSTLTGTSWGSAGTIGVVLMGIAVVIGADLGITAGAVVGGSYFGDKLSPLSDTTNMAALAAEVELFEHIRSMLVTTVPSALLAAAAYFVLGFVYPSAASQTDFEQVNELSMRLNTMFEFHPLLLAPPAVVLLASLWRRPAIPTLIASILIACLLALVYQRFAAADVFWSLATGFRADMAGWLDGVPAQTVALVERGGVASMTELLVIAFFLFSYFGAIDVIDAMSTVVNRVFAFAAGRRANVLAALASAAATNAITANQFATSFIVGDAFRRRFDQLQIPRKVLSRSIEDTGTMIESVLPWTLAGVFMTTTLGIAHAEFARWQLLSLINLVIAPLFALLGVGCYFPKDDHNGAP